MVLDRAAISPLNISCTGASSLGLYTQHEPFSSHHGTTSLQAGPSYCGSPKRLKHCSKTNNCGEGGQVFEKWQF